MATLNKPAAFVKQCAKMGCVQSQEQQKQQRDHRQHRSGRGGGSKQTSSYGPSHVVAAGGGGGRNSPEFYHQYHHPRSRQQASVSHNTNVSVAASKPVMVSTSIRNERVRAHKYKKLV